MAYQKRHETEKGSSLHERITQKLWMNSKRVRCLGSSPGTAIRSSDCLGTTFPDGPTRGSTCYLPGSVPSSTALPTRAG